MSPRFEERAPSAQTAIDIFAGDWAGDLSRILPVNGTGRLDLFDADQRPKHAAAHLGHKGRLEGMRILELGPLEGAHTWAMERLGADVTAVENNREAFLKCLVFKEVAGLKAKFLFGDVLEYLKTSSQFDAVFCSGILYHMAEPLALIELITKVTDKCFIWTHYYNKEYGDKEGKRTPRRVEREGLEVTYYDLAYDTNRQANGPWWSGGTPKRAWMEQNDILLAFKHWGFEKQIIIHDHPVLLPGATFSFVAKRPPLQKLNGLATPSSRHCIAPSP